MRTRHVALVTIVLGVTVTGFFLVRALTERDARALLSAAVPGQLDEHVRDLLRRQPVHGPHLIGRLAAAARSGQLTEDEAVRLVLLLFMTGFDTVTGGLTTEDLVAAERPAPA